MKIEFLYFAGCPSYKQALATLRGVMAETGVSAEIELKEVASDSRAAELNFHGSPTILVNGRDIDPEGCEGQSKGLSCRMYRHDDGRLSSLPSKETLRRALAGGSSDAS